MTPLIGSKLNQKVATAQLAGLAKHLLPGEEVIAVAKTNLMQPMCNAIAVTNARIVAFHGRDVERRGVRRQVAADQIDQIELPRKLSGSVMMVKTTTEEVVGFGALPGADFELIVGAARQLAASGVAPAVAAWLKAHAERQRQEATAWAGVAVVGDRPSERAWQLLKHQAAGGDIARFVVGARDGGAFAAFADRCVIVKIGVVTGFRATRGPSTEKVNAFRYADITGIEFSRGTVGGALIIRTSNDHGFADKEHGSPGAINPYALPNALPLDAHTYQRASPLLDDVRAKIVEAKRAQSS